MTMENNSLGVYNLTPDLLDQLSLLNALESRYIKLSNMHTMSKEQLVDIFQRVIAPLPQRISAHRRKHLAKVIESRSTEINPRHSIPTAFSKASTSFAHDRLKPPPDVINYERKKIRLGCSSTQKSISGTNLDNIVIKDRTKKEKSADDGTNKVQSIDNIIIRDRSKDIKPVEKNTMNDVGQSEDEEQVVLPPNSEKPRIKLKRSISVVSSEKSSSTETETVTKRQKKKIVF